jgi:hypothetical protein
MSAEPTGPDLTLGDVDADGALTEALAGVHGATRADLLRGAVLGGAALLGASGAPARAATSGGDEAILNYALGLEYLQAAFYTEVERNNVLHGARRRQARIVGAHERAHVRALRKVLDGKAAAQPRFDFRGATEDVGRFTKTAVAFEDLAVAAYKGQAPRIRSRELLMAALNIHSVEARHAAWIRRLRGVVPAATAFDPPRSKASTERVVDASHFVVTTRSRRRPPFVG